MGNDDDIETSRLRLALLKTDALELLLSHDVEGASRAQGFTFCDDFLETVNDVFLRRHLEGQRRWPATPGWYARAIIRKDDDALVGHCGFHGNPQDIGRAEIGYTIFTPYRQLGLATEAAQGLAQWARRQGSPTVVAAVAPGNAASLGVVKKLGFEQTGEQGSGDHHELVFELRL